MDGGRDSKAVVPGLSFSTGAGTIVMNREYREVTAKPKGGVNEVICRIPRENKARIRRQTAKILQFRKRRP